MAVSRVFASMLFVASIGCVDSEPAFEVLEDVGGLCILGDSMFSDTSYIENAPVRAHVVLESCAPCRASEITASCSIERDGTTLLVSASGSYWRPTDSGVCPTICAPVEATCTSGPLEAGSYTVEYAGETATFEVPYVGKAAQLGTSQLGTSECGL